MSTHILRPAIMQAAEDLSEHDNIVFRSELGLGGVVTCCIGLDNLLSEDGAEKVLIVARFGVIRSWETTLDVYAESRKYRTLVGDRGSKYKELKEEADIYIVNPEGVPGIMEFLETRDDIKHIVLDDTGILNKSTKGMQGVKALAALGKSVWVYTYKGTPDLFSEGKFVEMDLRDYFEGGTE